MRKLITLATAGLMVFSVAGTALATEPQDDVADKTTDVNLVVTLGTTVYAPADIDLTSVNLNAGGYPVTTDVIPGQVIANRAQLAWISNESDKQILVALTSALTNGTAIIPWSDMKLAGDAGGALGVGCKDSVAQCFWSAYLTDATTTEPVKDIAGVQLDTTGVDFYDDVLETGYFGVQVTVPAAAAGTYLGEVTFTVAAQ
jgi:hypothetical protein